MKEITLKQHNIVVLQCTASQSLAGNTPLASVLNGSTTTSQTVTVTGDKTFNVTIDTTNFVIGKALFDIKIGTVSSDTIALNIARNIA